MRQTSDEKKEKYQLGDYKVDPIPGVKFLIVATPCNYVSQNRLCFFSFGFIREYCPKA